MNQKKCPKCGEMNPAEAVMCWACYTPLTGGAPVAAGAPAGALAQPNAAAGADEEKKSIAPWQMGVIAAALLLGLGFGVSTMMGGTGDDAPTVNNSAIEVATPSGISSNQGTGGSQAPIISDGGGGGGGQSVTPAMSPFTVVTTPNPQLPWGIMAIVPTQANVSDTRAASLAGAAGRQFKANSPWKAMQVYVFRDAQSAQTFKQHQVGRRQDVLGPSDYASLSTIWPQCLARYEINGSREAIKYPSRSPGSWWR